MPRPVIALLTDFGSRDHYVAAMKGVILGIAPDVTLVDITHEIDPQDVLSAALELAACRPFFPAGTIFLVVVDPGVGTPRRAIAASAAGCLFVAPDNGVLGLVLESQPSPTVVELTERRYQRDEVSGTFEGRDRFAPVAAWLARGTDMRALGPAAGDLVRLDVPGPRISEDGVVGEVLKIDRFGNLMSNIRAGMLAEAGAGGALFVRAGRESCRLVGTYGQTEPGALCALIGSSGYLEVAVNGGSAAQRLGLGRGARIVVARVGEAPEAAGRE